MRQTTYGYTAPTKASVIISLQHPDHTSCLQPGCKKQDCKGNRVERVEQVCAPLSLLILTTKHAVTWEQWCLAEMSAPAKQDVVTPMSQGATRWWWCTTGTH